MEKYKIPVAPYKAVKSEKDIEKMVLRMPVVLKVDSPDIIHKTDVGCVLFVRDRNELLDSYKNILINAEKQSKDINCIIAQEFVFGSELIVGAKQDETFNYAIIFGAGGILTEVIKDISYAVPPIDHKIISSMLRQVKVWRKIKKRYCADEKKLEKIISNVAKLMEKNKKIHELDINPLFVNSSGFFAGDVRIIEKD